MAGAAGSRALSPPAASRAWTRYEFSIAGSADDAEVRRVLRERPLEGTIAVSLEREPDGRIGAAVDGDVHQTIVARDRASGRIAAIASRSVHDAYVNGQPARLGYLGQLRVTSPAGARRDLFDGGFEFCRALHDRGDTGLYLLSTAIGDTAAGRLLTRFRSPHAPRVKPVGAYRTLVFGAPRRPAASGFRRPLLGWTSGPPRRYEGIEFHAASSAFLDEIAACLDRNGRRFQFARVWRSQDLIDAERTPGLSPDNFVVATRGGRVIGCVAVWDQRGFKQTVVRAYGPSLVRWRVAINAGGRILGTPVLPPVGTRLEMVHLSHFAMDADAAHTAPLLVRHAARLAPADATHLVLGLAAENPVTALLARTLKHRSYDTLLQVAYWPDGARDALMLDARFPQPEAAML
jgi:hypothetical protein